MLKAGTDITPLSLSRIFIFLGQIELTSLLVGLLDSLDRAGGDAEFYDALTAFSIVAMALRREESISVPRLLRSFEEHFNVRPSTGFPASKMDEILQANPLRTFDARAWRRDRV